MPGLVLPRPLNAFLLVSQGLLLKNQQDQKGNPTPTHAPEPEIPLEPRRPPTAGDFEEDKAKGKGEKGESPGIGPRLEDGQLA
jgi:hypothetical protein